MLGDATPPRDPQNCYGVMETIYPICRRSDRLQIVAENEHLQGSTRLEEKICLFKKLPFFQQGFQ